MVGVPGHILVGHVQEVRDAKTFVDCQIACLQSEIDFDFICKSAMWYPHDNDQVIFFFTNNIVNLFK